jgi:hypothetical protein
MRRFVLATALLLAIGSLAAGCFDTSEVRRPTGAECGYDFSEDSAASCDGGVCLILSPNQQNMVGLCSKECFVNDDCTPHDRCVTVNLNVGESSTLCFRSCATDDDCYDAFVCRLLNVGDSNKFCLVDPG